MTSPGANPLNRPAGTGSGHTDSGTAAAKENAERLAERAKGRSAELKHQVEDTVSAVGARARSAADEQKNVAAERVGGVARALRLASDDLRDQGQPMLAEYSRHIVEGLETTAQSLSRGSLDDLVEGIEDFTRQRPVAFMGGAMVAGFTLARFMKSSAARRLQRTGPSETPDAWTGSPAATSPSGGAMPAASTSRPATAGMATPGVNRETPDATR